MKQTLHTLIRSCSIIVILGICLFAGNASAQPCKDWVAKLVSIQGIVTVQKAGQNEIKRIDLKQDMKSNIEEIQLSAGDRIFVGEKSRAAIVLCNESVLRLDQNTSLTIKGMERERTTLLDLLEGAIHFFSREPKSLKVSTPFVNGTVEGTEFLVKVDIEFKQTFMVIFEGKVAAVNDFGDLLLSKGQAALIQKGKAPVLYPVLRPRDAVQWALYYPPIIEFKAKDFGGAPAWEDHVEKSINAYWEGNLPQAFDQIEKVSEDIKDQRLYVYRAGLLLTVGRVDEAKADIDMALSIDAKDSRAISLQSIIAVVQNEKQRGLELARKAVELDSKSSVARIAQSYAQQAHFNIQEALGSVQIAVGIDPNNALSRARLAELWLSSGYLDKALVEANKAADLRPNIARIQTVLGFAYLTQIKTDKAAKAFKKAIEIDQAAPLSRLGLGLAKIREGKLKEGRADIEVAAALDVNNALIRSYLGKAYFEEKRRPKDSIQFETAKELDPNDPTPYFYDAIRKQTENRPIEALKDLQKSIELNKNRAVYRSQLLLDQDLAARSASLGRIYRDLGFEQLALVEGWKSVNNDPSNYSAHRFLADTYSTLPRHEIARISELLQSQLLQPINITPLQPSLSEGDLFILEGAGPADPAFNEYNPLFARNRVALQSSGVAGDNETWGDELTISGVYKALSASLGQFYYESDGFRENNDQKQEIYNIFGQANLSHKTNIQTEVRYSEKERGDLQLRFENDNFFASERREDRTSHARVGIHHTFNPSSDLIASVIYQNLDSTTFDTSQDFPFEFQTDEEGVLAELQQIQKSDMISFVGGFGYFNSDRENAESFFLSPFLITKSDIEHTNIYLYSDIDYPKNITWTLGFSGDLLEGALVDEDQINPKFGVTWRPMAHTTLRGAIFRTLNRTLLSSQTIEPTQVAGFNQFFDESEGVDAWRYGVALDQKMRFSEPDWYFRDIFIGAGIEYSKRELEVPFKFFDPTFPLGDVRTADWEEDLVRAYVYFTPNQWIAINAEYQYEDLVRDRDFVGSDQFTDLKTHRVPLGFSIFHPKGFIAKFKATYVDQSGEFGNPLLSTINDNDQFWVLDASIGYRFPKRYGLFSIEVKNLIDEDFNFQDTDPANPRIYPERLIMARITFSF